jgi:hypothetical protein
MALGQLNVGVPIVDIAGRLEMPDIFGSYMKGKAAAAEFQQRQAETAATNYKTRLGEATMPYDVKMSRLEAEMYPEAQRADIAYKNALTGRNRLAIDQSMQEQNTLEQASNPDLSPQERRKYSSQLALQNPQYADEISKVVRQIDAPKLAKLSFTKSAIDQFNAGDTSKFATIKKNLAASGDQEDIDFANSLPDTFFDLSPEQQASTKERLTEYSNVAQDMIGEYGSLNEVEPMREIAKRYGLEGAYDQYGSTNNAFLNSLAKKQSDEAERNIIGFEIANPGKKMPSAQEAKDLSEKTALVEDFRTNLIPGMLDIIDRVGSKELPISEAGAELSSKYQQFLLQYKELYKLGALQEGEIALINNVLKNPTDVTNWKVALGNKNALLNQFNKFQTSVEKGFASQMKTRGYVPEVDSPYGKYFQEDRPKDSNVPEAGDVEGQINAKVQDGVEEKIIDFNDPQAPISASETISWENM